MHLPVWAAGNVYLNGARAWEKEADACVDDAHAVTLALKESDGRWRLETKLGALLPEGVAAPVDTARLGMAFEPEQLYENPDGTPIDFDRDFFDRPLGAGRIAGPFAAPVPAEGIDVDNRRI